VQRASAFEIGYRLSKFGKPTDRREWNMTPPTVNAYEDAQSNTINFPAGILQPPFFEAAQVDAVNFGAIGAVIGHEIIHGYDDQGRKFDAQGNLRDWWTPEDAKNFDARAECVSKQFDSYVVEGDLHENGRLELGESIADLGGLVLAYRALEQNIEGKPHTPIGGFTPEQYGLTGTFIAIANIMFSFANFGMVSYIYKFYPYYNDNLRPDENDMMSWALLTSSVGFVFVIASGLIFKDLVTGVPTAYHDLESLLTNGDQQLRDTFGHLPNFLKKLVEKLPDQLTEHLGPEFLAAAGEKTSQSGLNVENAGKAAAAARKMGLKTPSLKELVGKPTALAGMLRSIITFLRARFPAVLGMNVLWSLALFSK